MNIKNTAFFYATVSEAKEELSKDDDFITNFSRFDFCARMGTDTPKTLADYKEFVCSKVRDFTFEEREILDEVMPNIRNDIGVFNLSYPENIYIVKTNGEDEGDAAYTRNKNVIVLPESMFKMPKARLQQIITHELFHIFTKNNPDVQEKLYNAIGFVKGEEVVLDDNLVDLKISNPDTPIYNTYFVAKTKKGEMKLAPVLIADQPYSTAKGGKFFEYMKLYFVNSHAHETYYTLADITNFFDMVGRNTEYIIHAEEILAENFVLTVQKAPQLNSPFVVEKMTKIFKSL